MIEDALKELRAESERLRLQLDLVSECIVNLERLQEPRRVATERRGRKSMDAAERIEVSERMKRYWSRQKNVRAMTAAAGSDRTQ